MMPASVVVCWGAYNDKRETRALLVKTQAADQPKWLFADARYVAEWVHRFCREGWHVETWIPPGVHRKDGTINGHYRSQMAAGIMKQKRYWRRWIAESFISGLKQTTGSALHARDERSPFVEAGLRVLAYAIQC